MVLIEVLVADDHPLVRKGIRQALSETDDIAVAGEAGDCAEVLQKVRKRKYDVLLLDISMPGRGGIDVLKQIRGMGMDVPVLMLSVFPEEQYALRALKAGASGYLVKSCEPEVLVGAIRKVAGGGRYVSEGMGERLAGEVGGGGVGRQLHEGLSDREYEVLVGIASGKTVKEIAEGMSLSVKTVSTYRGRILEKMRMRNNVELTRYAVENKLVPQTNNL
jgi:DNA-binding NarL/FixJ family response regulator